MSYCRQDHETAWSLAQSDNGVGVVYSVSAVPEPSTYAALLGAVVPAAAFIRHGSDTPKLARRGGRASA